jgi:AraC-like DNA-binding protein
MRCVAHRAEQIYSAPRPTPLVILRQTTQHDQTLGILNPREGFERFTLTRHAPSPALSPFIDRYWIIRWDLRDAPPFKQETLPHPCCNMVIEPSLAAVHGVGLRRFVATLDGQGVVVSAKFHPGGLSALSHTPLTTLAGTHHPIQDVFSTSQEITDKLISDVRSAALDAEAIAHIETFLLSLDPVEDPQATLATRLVNTARTCREITTVEALAEHAAMTTRTLQRLFARHVGVSPKWVIRRARVQEAAERVKGGERIDWAALALELGYFDQPHLTRDFKAQTGRTPAEYAAQCS